MTKGTTKAKAPKAAKTSAQIKATATKRPPTKARAPSKTARKTLKPAVHAESQAFDGFSSVMTARANLHGQRPTKLIKDGDGWLICYIQADGSYANCEPYTGPVE